MQVVDKNARSALMRSSSGYGPKPEGLEDHLASSSVKSLGKTALSQIAWIYGTLKVRLDQFKPKILFYEVSLCLSLEQYRLALKNI